MPHELFGEISDPTTKVGTKQWYTVPLSILAHVAALFALVVIPLMATDMLPTLRKLGSPLEGHPNMRRLTGVEASTGSLAEEPLGGRIAVTTFAPPPLPQDPRTRSSAMIGELTLRLLKACAYSHNTLPLAGSRAEMPCDWLLKTTARGPSFGS